MFLKIGVLKIFEIFYRKIPVLESLLDKVYYKQTPIHVFLVKSETFFIFNTFL